MTGNFPLGFAGFQAALEACVEATGGDWLARAAVEEEFQRAVHRQVRRREVERGQERPFEYPRPHRSDWMSATEEDWAIAAKDASASFFFPDDAPPKIPDGQRFAIVWGSRAIARATRQAGLILATRSRASIHFSDAGYRLARDNGITMRSHHRHFRTEDAAIAFFPRLAEKEFKLP